jgi:hypothetical protein
MGRKAFFIESKQETKEWHLCDKCGLRIKDVGDGKSFWNPNPRAVDRNICRNCYDVFQHEREEGRRRWQDKFSALQKTDQDGANERSERV